MQECEKNVELLKKLCKEYAKAKGFGISSRLDQHPVFYRLMTICKRTKEKCERENVLIFHQKVPAEGDIFFHFNNLDLILIKKNLIILK